MILRNFVVFEGIDGAGTSTQLNILKNRPEKDLFMFTEEPSPSATGRFLRQILKGDVVLDPKTTAYLFAADRCEHIWGKNGVKEACDSGKIVISDRYLFSSLAYQGVDCGEELPYELNKNFPLPELLFFFYIDPAKSLERIKNRSITEIYENKPFLDKTASRYRKVIDSFKQNQSEMKIVEIDGTKSKEEIEKIIWSNLSNLPIIKR